MGFAFAHHFASYDAVEALTHYRKRFKPSGWRQTPNGILAVAAVCAETDAEAEKLATSMDLNRLRRDRGQYLPLPSVEEALAYPYSDAERASIARNRSRLFVGSPATVMAKLQPMITASEADELMIITAVYDHDARKKSYSLLADAFGLAKTGGGVARRYSAFPLNVARKGWAGYTPTMRNSREKNFSSSSANASPVSSGWPSTSE